MVSVTALPGSSNESPAGVLARSRRRLVDGVAVDPLDAARATTKPGLGRSRCGPAARSSRRRWAPPCVSGDSGNSESLTRNHPAISSATASSPSTTHRPVRGGLSAGGSAAGSGRRGGVGATDAATGAGRGGSGVGDRVRPRPRPVARRGSARCRCASRRPTGSGPRGAWRATSSRWRRPRAAGRCRGRTAGRPARARAGRPPRPGCRRRTAGGR